LESKKISWQGLNDMLAVSGKQLAVGSWQLAKKIGFHCPLPISHDL
jgi:hypothetical protein